MWYAPAETASRSAVILLPPFAEEMNKSRHMFTVLAEALVERGFNVVLPDLYGTGDSEGDFGDATWQGWLDDIARSVAYMRAQGVEEFSCVALRSGALLAIDYLRCHGLDLRKLVFWHPVIDGGNYLNQFLRLRLAASMIGGGENRETTKALKEAFAAGSSVEVAGYALSPDLAHGLESVSLKDIDVSRLPSICWLDLVQSEGQGPLLANQKLIECWRAAGFSLEYRRVVGEPFWGSVDIVELPALIEQTVDCLGVGL